MLKAIRFVTGIVALAATAVLLASCGEKPARKPAPMLVAPVPLPAPVVLPEIQGKALLMHYMPWYKTPAVRGAWGSHWTGHQQEHNPDNIGADGLPDIWSHYHPLIGLYDSADPAVIECHLLQMKLAGVDGVIVDWYGISNTADYPEMHAATKALFDAAGALGMYFAVCFEDRSVQLMVEWSRIPPQGTTNHLAETFQWMQQEWFDQPQYFQHNGRPLFLNFGPMYLNNPEIWNAAMAGLPVRPLFYGLHHLWRTAGADGGFTWVHPDPWDGGFSDETVKVRIGEVFTYFSKNPAEVIVSAFPGFNDVYVEGHRQLDHRGGQVMQQTLEVAMNGPWPIVQLVTWNDYGEGTMIEPTMEFGYTFLEAVQDARRRERGPAFPFTAADLRLPERLLELRKAGGVPGATLDRIARCLKTGACAEARRELDGLARP